MPAKCTGAELKQFFEDKSYWPEDGDDPTYYDDAEILINGKDASDGFDYENLQPGDHIEVRGGCVGGDVVGPAEPDLADYLQRWLDARTTKTVVIQVPVEAIGAILVAVEAAGGRVIQ